jgi:ribosomal protein L37E
MNRMVRCAQCGADTFDTEEQYCAECGYSLSRRSAYLESADCAENGSVCTENAPRERTAVAGTLDGVVGKDGGDE